MEIKFTHENGKHYGKFFVNLKDNHVVEAIWDSLPIGYRLCYWGDSLWIQLPINISEELEQIDIEAGDVVYWQTGKQIHIYYGKTPISEGENPKLFGPAIKLGRLVEDPKSFKDLLKIIPRRDTYIILSQLNDRKDE